MSNTSNIPKRKRLRQPQRLIVAKTWLDKNQGKRISPRYAKWFGVDLLCAIKELRLLGVVIPPEYESNIKRCVGNKVIQKRKRLEMGKETINVSIVDRDEYFAFIVGYTSGGAPYGITWEEQQQDEQNTDHSQNLHFF